MPISPKATDETRVRAICIAALLGLSLLTVRAANAKPSIAQIDAAARAAGNRKDVATAIGRALLVRVWPAQIVRVRVDGIGRHLVAALVISAVKFHGNLNERGFGDEVLALVRRSFAAAPIEEVDVWATVPLAVAPGLPVSGDFAAPTSETVFAVTVTRGQAPGLRERLARGDGVFWDGAFRARLRRTQTPLRQ